MSFINENMKSLIPPFHMKMGVHASNVGMANNHWVFLVDAICCVSGFSPILPIFNVQMGRSAGFNLGGTYSSHRPQQQQQQQHAPSVSSSGVSFSPLNNQDLLHLHGSDMFPSSHSTYHSQVF